MLKRKAWRAGQFESRRNCSLEDLIILPGLLPFVEDGLSAELIAQARESRDPLIKAWKTHGPHRRAYGKFDAKDLLDAETVTACNEEDKDPWDLIELCTNLGDG